MQLPGKVYVLEVGTRDGFQAEHQLIPTERKIEVINALSRTGVTQIQATSFVHPRAVPQLADAGEVMERIDRVPGVEYQVLVPNVKGVQRAIAAKADSIHLMMSASESHNRANGNRAIDETLAEIAQMVPLAQEAGLIVDGGIACSFGCPFEGDVPPASVERIVKRLREMGVTRMTLGDTIGVANPRQVYDLAARMRDNYPEVVWTLHLHNTRDMALPNVLAAMQAGWIRFEGAVGGLGGCPYAPGATGNVATEDLLNMLIEMGIETGVDLDAMIAVAKDVRELVGHPLDSCMVKAGKRTDLKPAPKEQQKVG